MDFLRAEDGAVCVGGSVFFFFAYSYLDNTLLLKDANWSNNLYYRAKPYECFFKFEFSLFI
jgi:hypothetical protein